MERIPFETYAGFAIRAGKLLRGVNAIRCSHKRIYSLWLCESASENTAKEARSLALGKSVPLYVTRGKTISDLVHKENCKLVAFLDASLSDAAEKSAGEYFLKVNLIGGV